VNALRTREIQRGAERARTGPWRGDRQVACINPVPGTPPPSVDLVRQCLCALAGEGFERAVTTALPPTEQGGFRAAGFRPVEHLELLRHDLRRLPLVPEAPASLRRALASDRAVVLRLDNLAFEPFWRLDAPGLDEAIAATPSTRFRVAVGGDDAVVAYAIIGRGGRRGYVQRLAVHPKHRRQGIASTLVLDGLRWLRRWRTDYAVVNTQAGNDVALTLYESLGFHRQPGGLSVLGIDLR
jgi:ribosomal protein S18 acetylase RimI-like enzyme